MQKLISRLSPFIILGISLVALTFGLILLSYMFLFGAAVGIILYIINWIKQKYFTPTQPPAKSRPGRTIDSDDWRVL
jgi:hypothetical protein